MSEELNGKLNAAIVKCEDILRNIGEARNAINRKKELESALIEVALNQKGDESITEEMKKVDASLAELENKIKKELIELEEQLDTMKDTYNTRVEEKVGKIKELMGPGKNV